MNNFDDLFDNNLTGAKGLIITKEEFAAIKKAERDSAFALADKTALEIANDGGRLRQYLDVQSRFERYGVVNALLVLAQNPAAVQLRGFKQWKERGCAVQPGQTGIGIVEPQEYIRADGSPGIGYNVKKVFDITQVNARKLKSQPSPSFSERQLMKALIYNAPVKITAVDDLPDDACTRTSPISGEIQVCKGLDFAIAFRSLAQELAYASLTTGPEGQKDAVFSAFCTSYLLCQKYGVDTQGFNFDIAPAIFEGMSAQDVKSELSQIRAAAEDISGRMAKQLEAVQREPLRQEAR